jgi:diguanylate cyclase (GGDEF)-like protein
MAEIDRANRYGAGFTLVMMDVDHFKRINDTWGHHTGDIVLVNIARLARDTMRSSDALARWGGEEFIALLPMTGVAGALHFSERVNQALTNFAFEPVPEVTCSFGVTEFISGDSPESLTQRADAALYLAKERGRNRTEVNLADSAS